MIATDLERGKFFEHKGELLQVTARNLVTCGTHSHTKLVFTVCNIMGKQEKKITLAHNDRVDMVDITKKKATIISISGNDVQIMDIQSYETLDAKVNSSILSSLVEGEEITYINYKGIQILEKKMN